MAAIIILSIVAMVELAIIIALLRICSIYKRDMGVYRRLWKLAENLLFNESEPF